MSESTRDGGVQRENWRSRVREVMASHNAFNKADPNHEVPSIFRIGRLLRRRTELQAWKEFEANLPADYFE